MDSETEQLRRQFAAEFIRFIHERIPKERRKHTAWVFVSAEVDDPAGPQIVSSFDRAELTADFLEVMVELVRDSEHALVAPAPRSS